MPLPPYPSDDLNVRRNRYTVNPTSPAPLVGVTPDDQVFALDSIRAFRVGLQADAGQTLTGTGTLRTHFLDALAGAGEWGDNPDLDLSVPSGAAGKRTFWFPDVQVYVPAGRMHLRTDGIGVSGGQVTVHVQGWAGAR